MLEELTDDHLLRYTDHLNAVKTDMEIFFSLDVPDWVVPNGCVQKRVHNPGETRFWSKWRGSKSSFPAVCLECNVAHARSAFPSIVFCSLHSPPHTKLRSHASAKLCTQADVIPQPAKCNLLRCTQTQADKKCPCNILFVSAPWRKYKHILPISPFSNHYQFCFINTFLLTILYLTTSD